MERFKQSLKRIQLRELAIQTLIDDASVPDQERNTINEAYRQYNYAFYGIRAVPVLFMAVLAKTRVLSRNSPLFLKEISLVVGLTSGIMYADYWNSEYLWKNHGTMIKQFTQYNELGMDQRRMQQMQAMYEKGRQFKPANDQSDKMYE